MRYFLDNYNNEEDNKVVSSVFQSIIALSLGQTKHLAAVAIVLTGTIFAVSPSAAAQSLGDTSAAWTDIVARLQYEQMRIESCLSVIKRYEIPAKLAQIEIDYGNARAASNSLITALATGLDAADEKLAVPVTLNMNNFRTQLKRSVDFGDALCGRAKRVAPSSGGDHSLISGQPAGSLATLGSGDSSLFPPSTLSGNSFRTTIRGGLVKALWRSFSEIGPNS